MPEFSYKAKNMQGSAVNGVLEAASSEALEALLNERGYFLLESRINEQSLSLASFTERVNKRDLAVFCRQLSVVLNSGITILEAISILSEQVQKKTFRAALATVRDDLQKGRLLSQAMGAFPSIFPEFLLNMVRIGEASGTLETVMEQMADFYENEDRINRKVKSAMTYPAILSVMLVGVVILLMVAVLPTFSGVLNDMGGQMPGITRALMAISDFMTANIVYILIVIGLVIAFRYYYIRTENGRLRSDTFKITHSLFKNVNVKVVTARFARSLGILLKSGMNIINAFDLMAGLMGNRAVEQRFMKSAEEVEQGRGISESLAKMRLFPPLLIHMVAIGEQTGELDQMLTRTSRFFDDEVDVAIQKLTAMIEPIMIILLAGVIAVVLLSIFLPMLEIMNNVH
ncbi:MAG: type II secretion system F family protein [Clostridiaceae bacterium]|nr:type II secretion system F family protein [Eubacteriales bacterium]